MRIKYIASGYVHDMDKLLKDFISQESLEFSTFRDIWQKHNFYCIFMGRPDVKEYCEFVNEIYQLTLNHMLTSTLEYQIGGTFILYALYCNQIRDYAVKIRVLQRHYELILNIDKIAVQRKIVTLCSVIKFLFENCLELVAFPNLYGPCCMNTKVHYLKPIANEFGLLTNLQQDMAQFWENNNMDELKNIHTTYLDMKSSILPPQKDDNPPSSISISYDKFKDNLAALLGKRKKEMKSGTGSDPIGTRRVELKYTSFQRKAKFRYLNTDDDESREVPLNNIPSTKKVRKYKRKRRVPPHERRIGRPKKKRESDHTSEESDSHSPIKFPVSEDKSYHGKRGVVGRNRVSYLSTNEPDILDLPNPVVKIDPDLSDISDESSDDLRF